MLFQSLEVKHRVMLMTIVHKLSVNLIGDDEDIVLDGQCCNRFKFIFAVEVAGRVAGVTQEDGPCFRPNKRFQMADWGQSKVVFNARNHRLHHRTKGCGKTHVIGVIGLRDNDFLTGIKDAPHSK